MGLWGTLKQWLRIDTDTDVTTDAVTETLDDTDDTSSAWSEQGEEQVDEEDEDCFKRAMEQKVQPAPTTSLPRALATAT